MNIRSDFDLLWVNLGLVGDKYDSDAHNSFGVLSLSSSESRSVDKIALSVLYIGPLDLRDMISDLKSTPSSLRATHSLKVKVEIECVQEHFNLVTRCPRSPFRLAYSSRQEVSSFYSIVKTRTHFLAARVQHCRLVSPQGLAHPSS